MENTATTGPTHSQLVRVFRHPIAETLGRRDRMSALMMCFLEELGASRPSIRQGCIGKSAKEWWYVTASMSLDEAPAY